MTAPRTDAELFAEGLRVFAQYRVPISYSKLWRLIKRWRASAEAEAEFGDWVVTYADPTGEIAVNHVLGGRRG